MRFLDHRYGVPTGRPRGAATLAVLAGGLLLFAATAFTAAASASLTRTAGVRQFLDIGTGIPTVNNTHEVAHTADPGASIVYVDNDPMVLAHARGLLTASRPNTTSYLDADLRDTAKILTAAAALLDFRKPIGVLLIGILQLIPDEDDPRAIVASLMEAVPPGSWLAIFQPFTAAEARKALRTSRHVGIPLLEWLDREGVTRRLPDDRRVMRETPGTRGRTEDNEHPGRLDGRGLRRSRP